MTMITINISKDRFFDNYNNNTFVDSLKTYVDTLTSVNLTKHETVYLERFEKNKHIIEIQFDDKKKRRFKT